jgi:hypothetical protein
MELYSYYNLDECADRKLVNRVLKTYQKEGKIEYSIESELLKIEDIDLDEDDVQYLSDLFEENDVFPNTDRDDEDDDDYYSGFGEDYDDDY